jgi:short-subunit dehydrogenase
LTSSPTGTALITGASSGIGRALALALAAEGYSVGLIARRAALLAEVASEVRALGGTVAVAVADVGQRQEVRCAVEDVTRALGPVDLMIANAGVGMPTLLDPVNMNDVEEMFLVNLMGVIYAFEAVMPNMLQRHAGHLVGISSLAGDKGFPGESAYCASKAAVNTYLEGLRIQLRARGIAVTTVCPGFVRTPMTAGNTFSMPFVLEVDDVARRIVRALRHGRGGVVRFPWQTSCLTRLARWAPDALVARLFRAYHEQPPLKVPATVSEAEPTGDSTRSR